MKKKKKNNNNKKSAGQRTIKPIAFTYSTIDWMGWLDCMNQMAINTLTIVNIWSKLVCVRVRVSKIKTETERFICIYDQPINCLYWPQITLSECVCMPYNDFLGVVSFVSVCGSVFFFIWIDSCTNHLCAMRTCLVSEWLREYVCAFMGISVRTPSICCKLYPSQPLVYICHVRQGAKSVLMLKR